MAEITPEMVKKLREKTDAGMLDCKKALQEAEGDFDKAEKILKEKGLAAAGKRADRATGQGKVFIKIDDSKATALELSCETDFVAKTDQFVKLGEALAAKAWQEGLNEPTPDLEAPVKEAIGVLKENMAVKRVRTLNLAADEAAAGYLHDGGVIGVIVKAKITGDKSNPKVQEFLTDCAMHVAAYAPLYLDASRVDPKYIAEQREIFIAQTKALGKPEQVAQNIAEGKLKKHLAEICFVDQAFVKEPKHTVAAMGHAIGKEIGGDIVISDYINFRVGVE